jgi:superfamily I DNA/RNA helicase
LAVLATSVKAAHELRQRLSDTLSPDLVGMMAVMTLHAPGLRLLREHGD